MIYNKCSAVCMCVIINALLLKGPSISGQLRFLVKVIFERFEYMDIYIFHTGIKKQT